MSGALWCLMVPYTPQHLPCMSREKIGAQPNAPSWPQIQHWSTPVQHRKYQGMLKHLCVKNSKSMLLRQSSSHSPGLFLSASLTRFRSKCHNEVSSCHDSPTSTSQSSQVSIILEYFEHRKHTSRISRRVLLVSQELTPGASGRFYRRLVTTKKDCQKNLWFPCLTSNCPKWRWQFLPLQVLCHLTKCNLRSHWKTSHRVSLRIICRTTESSATTTVLNHAVKAEELSIVALDATAVDKINSGDVPRSQDPPSQAAIQVVQFFCQLVEVERALR